VQLSQKLRKKRQTPHRRYFFQPPHQSSTPCWTSLVSSTKAQLSIDSLWIPNSELRDVSGPQEQKQKQKERKEKQNLN
jgi:hypothetical protein